MSVLDELQHHSALPWHVRQIRLSSEAVEQIAARAADEIERLHRELAKARAALHKIAKVEITGDSLLPHEVEWLRAIAREALKT